MPGSFRIARILGIDVRVHLSWVLIFLLFTYQQSQDFDLSYPSWSTGKSVLVGAITALLFFTSVVFHEFAHSLVARSFKMPVSSITLFLLGGVASLTREPPTARAEFLMAAAGPATSLAIGGVAYAVEAALGFPPRDTAAQIAKAIAGSLAYINVAVAIFNLIPGFPLDGGRVLRSSIWGVTHDRRAATTIAARGGQIVAGLFVLGAGFFVLNGEPTGLWWGLIAYFLYGAASQTLQQERVTQSLGAARVSQLMTNDLQSVPRGISIGQLVREVMLPRNLRVVPVVDGGKFAGVVTIGDLRKVEQDQWPVTAVDAVMTGAADLPTVTANEELASALEKFGSDLSLLPVVDAGGALVGLLHRESVVGYVRMREMLDLDQRRR
ncbi:MAG TPA: site-2 protease family protein [Candidatus Acidoferrales bacterium]|nr:site-2 protease family protein [Candidatus Acidoferrales bacterium]